MKILWLTNAPLGRIGASGSGSWLDATAAGLLAGGDIELAVIACADAVAGSLPEGVSEQWYLPMLRMAPNGTLHDGAVRSAMRIVSKFRPDITNVWGTEYATGLLTARRQITGPSILTLQGLRYRIAESYHGGLTSQEMRRSRGLWQWIRGVSVANEAAAHGSWQECEREIIQGHKAIICQSAWQEAHAQDSNPGATVYRIDLPLRAPFDRAAPWMSPQGRGSPRIFCSASYVAPFKGLHVAVRALRILKRQFPLVVLRIAGHMPGNGLRQDGYLRWLASEIEKFNLEANVCWLGQLTAEQIVNEMHSASAMVIPSFIESYSLAFAEALRVGVPAVVTYNGGTSHLGQSEESCLFFPPGDEAFCAYQLARLFKDNDLSTRISRNARAQAAVRHDASKLARQLLDVYGATIESQK